MQRATARCTRTPQVRSCVSDNFAGQYRFGEYWGTASRALGVFTDVCLSISTKGGTQIIRKRFTRNHTTHVSPTEGPRPDRIDCHRVIGDSKFTRRCEKNHAYRANGMTQRRVCCKSMFLGTNMSCRYVQTCTRSSFNSSKLVKYNLANIRGPLKRLYTHPQQPAHNTRRRTGIGWEKRRYVHTEASRRFNGTSLHTQAAINTQTYPPMLSHHRSGLHTEASVGVIMSQSHAHAQKRRLSALALLEEEKVKLVHAPVHNDKRQLGRHADTTVQTMKHTPWRKEVDLKMVMKDMRHTEVLNNASGSINKAPISRNVGSCDGTPGRTDNQTNTGVKESEKSIAMDCRVSRSDADTGTDSSRPMRADKVTDGIGLEESRREISTDTSAAVAQPAHRYSHTEWRVSPVREYIRLNNISEALRSTNKQIVASGALLLRSTPMTQSSTLDNNNGKARSHHNVELQNEAQLRSFPSSAYPINSHSHSHSHTHAHARSSGQREGNLERTRDRTLRRLRAEPRMFRQGQEHPQSGTITYTPTSTRNGPEGRTRHRERREPQRRVRAQLEMTTPKPLIPDELACHPPASRSLTHSEDSIDTGTKAQQIMRSKSHTLLPVRQATHEQNESALAKSEMHRPTKQSVDEDLTQANTLQYMTRKEKQRVRSMRRLQHRVDKLDEERRSGLVKAGKAMDAGVPAIKPSEGLSGTRAVAKGTNVETPQQMYSVESRGVATDVQMKVRGILEEYIEARSLLPKSYPGQPAHTLAANAVNLRKGQTTSVMEMSLEGKHNAADRERDIRAVTQTKIRKLIGEYIAIHSEHLRGLDVGAEQKHITSAGIGVDIHGMQKSVIIEARSILEFAVKKVTEESERISQKRSISENGKLPIESKASVALTEGKSEMRIGQRSDLPVNSSITAHDVQAMPGTEGRKRIGHKAQDIVAAVTSRSMESRDQIIKPGSAEQRAARPAQTHEKLQTHLAKKREVIGMKDKLVKSGNEKEMAFEREKWRKVYTRVTNPDVMLPQHVYSALYSFNNVSITPGGQSTLQPNPLRHMRPSVEATHALVACSWRISQMAERGLNPMYNSREFLGMREALMRRKVRLEYMQDIMYASQAALLWQHSIQRYPRGFGSIAIVQSLTDALKIKVRKGICEMAERDAKAVPVNNQFGEEVLSRYHRPPTPEDKCDTSALSQLVDVMDTLPSLSGMGLGTFNAVFAYARPRISYLDATQLVRSAHVCALSLDVLDTHLNPSTLGVRAQYMGELLHHASLKIGKLTDQQLHTLMGATASMIEPILVQFKAAQRSTQLTGRRDTRNARRSLLNDSLSIPVHNVDLKVIESAYDVWCTVAQSQLTNKGQVLLESYRKDSSHTMKLLEVYIETVASSMRIRRSLDEVRVGYSSDQPFDETRQISAENNTKAQSMLMRTVHKLCVRAMAESDSHLLASLAEVYRLQDKPLSGMSDDDRRHLRCISGSAWRDESILSTIMHKLYAQPETWWEEMSVLRKASDSFKRLLWQRKQLFGTPYDARRMPKLPLDFGDRSGSIDTLKEDCSATMSAGSSPSYEDASNVAIEHNSIGTKYKEYTQQQTYSKAYHNYKCKTQETFANPHASQPLALYTERQRDYLKQRLDRTELYAGDGTRLLSSPHPNDLRTLISVLGDAAHELPHNSSYVEGTFVGLSHLAAYRMPDFSPTQVVDVMEAFTKVCVNRWHKHPDMCERLEPFFNTAIAHVCNTPRHYVGQDLHRLLASCTHLGIADRDLYACLGESILISRNCLSGEDMTNIVVSYANAGFPMAVPSLACAINMLERDLSNLAGESLFRVALAMTMFSDHESKRRALLRAIASRFARVSYRDRAVSDRVIAPGGVVSDGHRTSSRLHPSTQIMLAGMHLSSPAHQERCTESAVERGVGSLYTVQPASKLVSLVEIMEAEGITNSAFYRALDVCVASRLHEFEPEEVQRVVYAISAAGGRTPKIIHAMEVQAGSY